jgi:hydrophobic/amphiphilic exporter-1 (mainly G- bacteria), HAE1 family
MGQLYKHPFKVYLLIGILALIGIYSGTQLPISLYPNANKPKIWAEIPYGNLSAKEFYDNFGSQIESNIKAIDEEGLEVNQVIAKYEHDSVNFEIDFNWGGKPKEALKEVQNVFVQSSFAWPKESRDTYQVNYWGDSSGFIAISFFSQEKSLDEIYDLLDPLLAPELKKVKDASEIMLWNPNKKDVSIKLKPTALARYEIFPYEIEKQLMTSLAGYRAGSLQVGLEKMQIELKRQIEDPNELSNLIIKTPKGVGVPLSVLAEVDFSQSEAVRRIFKTNGSASLILFGSPKNGGNIKRMAEETIAIVEKLSPQFPKDIEYKLLVDPSEFIRSSVNNVIHEVFIAAVLAVMILYFFLGSFKNTITAAIEIPLSMILAFILMRFFNINLNLISLGGLALSAGMNVDASVVVMENIFRHFHGARNDLSYEEKWKIIVRAVKEVSLPLISSTIASLVVFAPLAFTSDLTYAVLGDLAKAVVFSHGFSAIVAVILVPTIRLHLMSKDKAIVSEGKSPIEKQISWVEKIYQKSLKTFIAKKTLHYGVLIGVTLSLVLMSIFVLPKLKKEIIGLPDTDWLILGVEMSGNTEIRQMEIPAGKEEARLLSKFGDDIQYTFTQIQGANRASIMARLKNKKDMERVWKGIEKEFTNTPDVYFWVVPWNPAELPIPNPPAMEILIQGGEESERALTTRHLMRALKISEPFPRISTEVDVSHTEIFRFTPLYDRIRTMQKEGLNVSPEALADLALIATEGRRIGEMSFKSKMHDIRLGFPSGFMTSPEDLESFPVGIKGKMIPLRGMVQIERVPADPPIYRVDGNSLYSIEAKTNKGEEANKEQAISETTKLVEEFKTRYVKELNLKEPPSISLADPEKELNQAISELSFAILLSILLILLTLILQFGHFAHTMIVLTAIPTGMLGVMVSLWVFDSTISLNSILGIILLNGIAVANSIILVDFIRLHVEKLKIVPEEAAVMAAGKRLRPILITSLTTILGMLPIALGSGEGGKVLQPLGIAVSGGLWFSMLFTLYIVPLLEVKYFRRKLSFDDFDVDKKGNDIFERETKTLNHHELNA